MIGLWLIGCHTDREEWECVGPLVEIVRWRDEVELRMQFGGETFPDLAAQEDTQVREAVAVLKPRRAQCEMAWSILSMQEVDNPGLRIRARVIEELVR